MVEPGTTAPPVRKNPWILRRAAYGIAGLRRAWRRERAFRSQVLLAALALAILAAVGTSPLGWAVMVFALGAAIGIEAINAAIEALLDRLHPEHHPEIGAAKDIASAAAFVTNGAAAIVLAILVAEAVA